MNVFIHTQTTKHLEDVPEILRVLNDAVSKLDTNASSLFECLFQQQRFQNRVEFLGHILQQHLHIKHH